jgi:hypothetical protein
VATTEPVTATSTTSMLGSMVVSVVVVFSIGAGGGFLAGRGQNFALPGGSGSGLGATAREATQEKGRTARGHHGQFVAMQTVPKFGPRLRRRGHRGQNTSGRWAGFFLAPVKNGPIRTSPVYLRRAVGDVLSCLDSPEKNILATSLWPTSCTSPLLLLYVLSSASSSPFG